MAWLTSFLTGLLSSIIRPILEDLFASLKLELMDSMDRKRSYEKFDVEAQELTLKMASASTAEERFAILQQIKNARPKSLS
jgi:hypothetical protein